MNTIKYFIMIIILISFHAANGEQWYNFGYGEERGYYARLFGITFPADYEQDKRSGIVVPGLKEAFTQNNITKDDKAFHCLVLHNPERTMRIVANSQTTHSFHDENGWRDNNCRSAVRSYINSLFSLKMGCKYEEGYEVIWGILGDGLLAIYLDNNSSSCQMLFFTFLQGSNYEDHKGTVDKMIHSFRPFFWFIVRNAADCPLPSQQNRLDGRCSD